MGVGSGDRSLFRIKSYPAWFTVDTALLAGSASHWLALSLVAFELSGSVTAAGWFQTVRGLVSGVTQIVGGTFIDRHDHRTLMLFQSGVCALIWLTMAMLFMGGNLTFELFVALSLASSAIFGFLGGTTNAALIPVVGPERYAQAESVNQGRDAAVNTVGSSFGAALYDIAHAVPFLASAFFDGVAFVAALALRLPRRAKAEVSPEERNGFVQDMVLGFTWVFTSRTIVCGLVVMSLATFAMFGIHQTINLHLVESGIDALEISYVNLTSGLATIIGSVIANRLCDRVRAGRAIICCLALMACSQLPVVVLGSYGAVLAGQLLLGLPMPLLSALGMGLIFSKTPVDLQGRARAAVMCVTMLVTSGTGAVAGSLLPAVGFTALVGALDVLFVCAAFTACAVRRIRTLPTTGEWDSVEL